MPVASRLVRASSTAPLVLPVALVAVVAPAIGGGVSGRSISDALTVVGLIYLVVGLIRVVNAMGFFDSTRFGFAKVIEVIRTRAYTASASPIGTFADYRARARRHRPIARLLATACVLLVASLIVAMLA